jgi:hypothetical protein
MVVALYWDTPDRRRGRAKDPPEQLSQIVSVREPASFVTCTGAARQGFPNGVTFGVSATT